MECLRRAYPLPEWRLQGAGDLHGSIRSMSESRKGMGCQSQPRLLHGYASVAVRRNSEMPRSSRIDTRFGTRPAGDRETDRLRPGIRAGPEPHADRSFDESQIFRIDHY